MELKVEAIDITEAMVIMVLGVLAVIGAIKGNVDMALPIATGLTGYLTKSLKSS